MNHTCSERLHPVWSEMGQNENKKAEISSCAYLPRSLSFVVLLTPACVCSPDHTCDCFQVIVSYYVN